MEKYSDRGCLASRDIVARAIDSELKIQGDEFVYLDMRGIGERVVKSKFPNIYSACLDRGIDITSDLVPVVPAAHYVCGGVRTDTEGRTSIQGLYCAGETACTGVHGANRLASNSLLEAVVFSARACGAAIADQREFRAPELVSPFPGPPLPERERVVITHTRFEIKRLMWDYVGIVRSTARLRKAHARLLELNSEVQDMCRDLPLGTKLLDLRNIVNVALLITASAGLREESRGLHYNRDFPETDDIKWKRDTVLDRTTAGLAG